MTPSSKISFTQHPATVGETYAQHFQSAAGFSVRMIGAGLACLVHAVFPFLFERTGSTAIRNLHERMLLHRSRIHHIDSAILAASGGSQDQISGGVLSTRTSSK